MSLSFCTTCGEPIRTADRCCTYCGVPIPALKRLDCSADGRVPFSQPIEIGGTRFELSRLLDAAFDVAVRLYQAENQKLRSLGHSEFLQQLRAYAMAYSDDAIRQRFDANPNKDLRGVIAALASALINRPDFVKKLGSGRIAYSNDPREHFYAEAESIIGEFLAAFEADTARTNSDRNPIFDLQIGNDRLRMSESVIEYRGVRVDTQAVWHVRWGIYVLRVNSIPTQRMFTIWAGPIQIECVRFLDSWDLAHSRFCAIVEALWSIVGTRIMASMIRSLQVGNTVQVGAVQVTRGGLWLPHRTWFKTEPCFAQWSDVTKSCEDGFLNIGSIAVPKARASLSFRDTNNAVVLDRLLDLLRRDGNCERLQRGTLLRD